MMATLCLDCPHVCHDQCYLPGSSSRPLLQETCWRGQYQTRWGYCSSYSTSTWQTTVSHHPFLTLSGGCRSWDTSYWFGSPVLQITIHCTPHTSTALALPCAPACSVSDALMHPMVNPPSVVLQCAPANAHCLLSCYGLTYVLHVSRQTRPGWFSNQYTHLSAVTEPAVRESPRHHRHSQAERVGCVPQPAKRAPATVASRGGSLHHAVQPQSLHRHHSSAPSRQPAGH